MNTKPTYQDLLDANARLQEENCNLRQEVKRLKSLLKSDDEPGAYPIQHLSLEEKVELFRNLFKGREDVFARRWYSKNSGKSGYQPVCLNEWNRQLCDKRKYKCAECPNRQFKQLGYEDVYKHLEGKDADGCDVIGVYVILENNKCKFLCADFDDKSCEHGYQNDVLAYASVCKKWKIPCSIERSRSGNGAHVWIFFENPLDAAKARKLGNTILTQAMEHNGRITFKSYDRFFPNQDRLPHGGLGNLVALPLQGRARKMANSLFVNEAFAPYEDQWTYLLGVKKISETVVDELLVKYGTLSEFGELSTTSEEKPWNTPPSHDITKNDFPQKVCIIKSNMLYIPLKGISGKTLNYLKRIASFKNPEFYARQGMRLSTYNVPRIISCADILDEYVALPRGCEDVVADLLDRYEVPYCIEDKTQCSLSIQVRFKGELRKEQKEAVKSLAAHKNGVLNGTTAFGKTVTAIGLIAEHKINTLILVHTKTLLDQWKSRLEEFLDIDCKEVDTSHKRGRKKAFSPFGTLDSKGNSLHGMADVALMQSCFEEDSIKPFVRDYGMVIVDECHHVSAINFEKILKFVNASYVYGLTATPIRKDGHQPIIFMQCGPIRYSADVKMQIALQTFERLLVPRFTSYRELTEDKRMYSQTIQGMSNDERRNTLIIEDVRKALDEGRSPIALTSLTSHVELLAKLLAPYCKNIITLVGLESTKEKRSKMERLQNISAVEPLVIIATGRYVGEGFDYPRLDTLFLALPVSWKGIVAQYAGRLHREYPGKKDVRIFDYIDVHVPLCDKMYRRRLKGYAAIGYGLMKYNSLENCQSGQNAIFTGRNFQQQLLADLSQAGQSIIITSTKLGLPKHSPIFEMLQEAIIKGIEVILFTKSNSDKDDFLCKLGFKVIVKETLSVHTVIIDKSLLWYGSVNYLGYNTNDDNTIKWSDPSTADEMISLLYE